MVDQQEFFSATESVKVSSDFEYLQFKEDVKTKLKWDKSMWVSNGLENSNLNKLCNMVNYCRKNLDDAFDSATLFITFFNVNKEAYIDMKALFKEIQGLVPDKKILGYFRPRNRKVIALDFDSIETKLHVQERLIQVAGNWVVDLEWASKSNDIDLRLHWLHRRVSDAKISIFLAKHMTVTNVTREQSQYTASRKVDNSMFSIKAVLHPGVTVNDVPHLTYLGGLQTLITVKGRVAMCLACETLGHIAAKCPRPYCKICKINRPKKHLCNPPETKATYANAVHQVQESFKEYDFSDSFDSDLEEDINETETEVKMKDITPELQQQNFPDLSANLEDKAEKNIKNRAPKVNKKQTRLKTKTKVSRLSSQKVREKKTINNLEKKNEVDDHNELKPENNVKKKQKTEDGDGFQLVKYSAENLKTYAKTDTIKAKITSENLFDSLMDSQESTQGQSFL